MPPATVVRSYVRATKEWINRANVFHPLLWRALRSGRNLKREVKQQNGNEYFFFSESSWFEPFVISSEFMNVSPRRKISKEISSPYQASHVPMGIFYDLKYRKQPMRLKDIKKYLKFSVRFTEAILWMNVYRTIDNGRLCPEATFQWISGRSGVRYSVNLMLRNGPRIVRYEIPAEELQEVHPVHFGQYVETI